ncbi:MAG: acylphosphatase [Candidatus Methanoperedens sp.]|nr:acylphosphatase [Candidatus Methanoperedens sp.]
MQKCYNIIVTGKVQDTGFRALIEEVARLLDLKGFVFNDIDGSVKMVCCGENSAVSKLFTEIRTIGSRRGIVIDAIAKEELPSNIFLPERFSRLYTDDLGDIGRKLDIGNSELKGINTKLSPLDDRLSGLDNRLSGIDDKMSGIDGRLSGIGEDTHGLNEVMGSFVVEQRGHNKRLEKILEKLTER